MKDVVIKKTSDAEQRIVLQTDSESLDYQSRFTIMTISGAIDGVVLPFSVGSVTSLYEISQFLADNASAGIDVTVMSQNEEQEAVSAAVPRFLEAELYAIVDESSYKNKTFPGYAEKYPYDESMRASFPWLSLMTKKSVKASSFDLEISHNRSACTFGGNSSSFGTISGGKKMTVSDYSNLMFETKNDLGVDNPKGLWTVKLTMNNVSITREVTIE